MTENVTRREFARLERCDEKQVRRALERGLLTADSEGKLDPTLVGSGWRKPRADSREPASPGPRKVRTLGGEDNKNVRSDVRTNVRTVPTSEAAGQAPELPAGGPVGQGTAGATLRQAIAHKEDYAGRLKELEYRQKSGDLVELSLARQVLFNEFRAARDAWLNWPTRFAALIAADLGIEQVDRVADVLASYVHKQLKTLGEPRGGMGAQGPKSAQVATERHI